MTKKVRIENADTSDHKLDIEVWQRGGPGGDTLLRTMAADYPTTMIEEMVWQEQYLIVRERAPA